MKTLSGIKYNYFACYISCLMTSPNGITNFEIQTLVLADFLSHYTRTHILQPTV